MLRHLRDLATIARANVRARRADQAKRRAEHRGAVVPIIDQARAAFDVRPAFAYRFEQPDHEHEIVRMLRRAQARQASRL
jgi:hypothetical protein